MRDLVREVTSSEVLDLADRYGIEVGESEAAAIRDGINERLARFDDVHDVGTAERRGLGERSWWGPNEEDDPYNAISIHCHVEPASDHSDVLEGRTVVLKDVIAVAGVPLQCGSAAMQGFVPSSDATVTRRLRTAGATITGKANLDEFAGGGRGKSFRGRILNPHDTDRIAGGSSGGSAAAVAAELADLALGTDTGGSVRLPAAFCGVVGIKPTYGLVPLTGVIENTYSLDHVGAMASGVAETASVLEAIAGKDRDDPVSMGAAGRDDYRVGGYVEAARDPPDPGTLSVGLLSNGFEGVADGVRARAEETVERLAEAGANVEYVTVAGFDLAPVVKNAISYCELAGYWRDRGLPLRRGGDTGVDPGDRTGFARQMEGSTGDLGQFYRSRILAGAHLLEAHDGRHYLHALRAKRTIQQRFAASLEDVDVLAWPTTLDVAPRVDEADVSDTEFGRNTRPVNLTGLPAVSVPNGTVDGLPVGIQLLAPAFREARLLGIAAAVESLEPSSD